MTEVGWVTKRLYPHVDWEVRPFPNIEDYDNEADYDRELRATMLLNQATRAGWPTQAAFDRDFMMKIAFPILVVASIIIIPVMVVLFA